MAARSPSPPPGTVSLREAVQDLFESLRASVTTRLELVALEGRRAGIALAQMLLVGVLGAILAISAWLVAIWGITWGLMELGLAPWLAIVLVVVANLIGAWICVLAVRRLAQRLLFPATLKHLRVGNPPGSGSLPTDESAAPDTTSAANGAASASPR
ncbi:MAG TPA: phage holin family protein [Zeimonas sp.]|nr:phage holin family protein [Zeimonas sp.]